MPHTASGSFKNLTANSSLIKMSIGLLVTIGSCPTRILTAEVVFLISSCFLPCEIYRVKMVEKNRCEIRKLHLGCLAPKEYLLFLT